VNRQQQHVGPWRQHGYSRRRLLKGSVYGGAGAFMLAALGCGGGDGDKASAPQSGTSTAGGQGQGVGISASPAARTGPITPTGKIIYAYQDAATYETANPLEYYAGGQDSFRFAVADYLLHWVAADAPADQLLVPALAVAMPEATPDRLQWTFKLKPEAKFHDGTPVTSEDVKYSWELSLDPKFRHVRRPEISLGLDRIETPDPQTAVFKLKTVWLDVLDRNPQWAIISKAHAAKVGLDAIAAGNVVAAGAFKEVRFEKGQFHEMTAVENHYRKTPFIKDFSLRRVVEPATRVAQLASGEADITIITPDLLPEVDGKIRGTRVLKFEHSSSAFLVFKDMTAVPKGQSPMHDKRVREALSLAVDRKSIVQKIYGGLYDMAGTMSTKWTPGFDNSIQIHQYNVDKAKALLKEAGYENGFETTYYAAAPLDDAVQAMIDMWKRINVKVNLNLSDAATYNNLILDKNRPGLYIQTTAGQVSASGYLTFLQKEGRYSHYDDPVMEDMVTRLSGEGDRAKRDDLWRQIQRKVADDMVYVEMWQVTTLVAVGPKVRRWVPRRGVTLGFSNYEHLELA
jgi:peptide/nickel transport system substrate-binding protein